MPRRSRLEIPEGIFHVACRGVAKDLIFQDESDRRLFLSLLDDVVRRQRWRCLTFCLMGNHYHLVVKLREANLSVGMQRLNGDYARRFNDRHVRTGHLFQGRFWSTHVVTNGHLCALARYVALNPVAAGLCTAPEDWVWSAHPALVGRAPAGFVDLATMLSHFGADLENGRRRYRELLSVIDPRASDDLDRRVRPPMTVQQRDDAIACAIAAGRDIAGVARAVGCHPRTVERRLSRLARQGV